jgi:uncharacterized alpha-E superfamily protein
MLSRLANHLFWMGRYLERAEYLARYAQVHYYSALDANFLLPKEDVHTSVLKYPGMYDSFTEKYEGFKDRDVLYYLFLDPYNPHSVKHNIQATRYNARCSRDLLLTELWEAINILYHEVNDTVVLDIETFDEVSKSIRSNISIINGYIDNTLIHNEVWAILKAGQHIERAYQVTRILHTKWNEILAGRETEHSLDYENYLCITMLRSAESFDMSRIFFNKVPDTKNALMFLLSNDILPRSVAFNIHELESKIEILQLTKSRVYDDFKFKISRLNSQLHYLVHQDLNESPNNYLLSLIEQINELAFVFNNEYLT